MTHRLALWPVLRGLSFIVLLEAFWLNLDGPLQKFVQDDTGFTQPPQGHVLSSLSMTTGVVIDLIVSVTLTLILVATEPAAVETSRFSLTHLARRTNLGAGRERISQLLSGLVLGGGAAVVIMTALTGLGASRVSLEAATFRTALENLLPLVVVFAAIGFTEEFYFRGYVQRSLTDALGFWGATSVTCAWCMWSHHMSGDPAPGAAHAGLDAMFWCLALRASGSLAFGIGYHTA